MARRSWLTEREFREFEATAKREDWDGVPYDVMSYSRIMQAGATAGEMKIRGWTNLQDNRAGMFRRAKDEHASSAADHDDDPSGAAA